MTNNPKSPAEIKELVRQDWSGAAPLWKKWNHKSTVQSRAASELIARNAQLQPGMRVLDLASGTGEPSLTLAKAVGPSGRVTATDLVPEMLEAVREFAAAQNLSNMDFQLADAEHLPFSDAEFDRVTCRFGIMFFPEIPKALAEIRRVLKPSGRVSFLTWGPMDQNPLFSIALDPFLKLVQPPPPPPDAPHVFRFADPAKLAGVFAAAGYRDISAQPHTLPWPWHGTPEEAWQSISERAAPFKKLIAALPPEKFPAVLEEVLDGLRRHQSGDAIALTATLNALTAAV